MYLIIILLLICSVNSFTIKKQGYYLLESNEYNININGAIYRESINKIRKSKMLVKFRPGNYKSNVIKTNYIVNPLLSKISSEKSLIFRSLDGNQDNYLSEINYLTKSNHNLHLYFHSIGFCDPCWYNITITDSKNSFTKSFFKDEAEISFYQYNLKPGIYSWKLYLNNYYNYANIPTAGNGFMQNRVFFGYFFENKYKDSISITNQVLVNDILRINLLNQTGTFLQFGQKLLY